VSQSGRATAFPTGTVIRNNHIHEVGVFGKQTSCVQLILSANTTVADNVCYNGPRAGINRNDGFAGGDVYRGNLVFNMVRETADHGPVNTWDHQAFLTVNGVDDGFATAEKWGIAGASIIMRPINITQNFIINAYSGVWAIDHDDGSQFYNDVRNFLVFGGCKNFQGNHKTSRGNLILYPGMDGRSAGDRRCQTDDNHLVGAGSAFAEQYFVENNCATQDGVAYTYHLSTTANLSQQVYHSRNNTFYAPGKAFVQFIGGSNITFEDWQRLGQDIGSIVKEVPPISQLIAMAKRLLESRTPPHPHTPTPPPNSQWQLTRLGGRLSRMLPAALPPTHRGSTQYESWDSVDPVAFLAY
jgi:hypothetical protein